MFTVGDEVEFHTPTPDEVGGTYIFAEDKGDRCLIRLHTVDGKPHGLTFAPTMTVMTADLKKVGT